MSESSSTKRSYAYRYLVEPWGRPPTMDTQQVVPGIRVSDDNYGYSDELLVISILKNDKGEPSSIALFDTESKCGRPSRKLLTAVKYHIDHHLEHHCSKEEGG